MPPPIVYLFDVAFDLLNRERMDAFTCIAEFEKEYPHLLYYRYNPPVPFRGLLLVR